MLLIVRIVLTYTAYMLAFLVAAVTHKLQTGGEWGVDQQFIALIAAILVATDKHWSQP